MFFVGVSGSAWVNRGDVAAVDKYQETLTLDGGWYDWDISPIVGVGKRLVLLKLEMKESVGGKKFQVRTTGNTNSQNVSSNRTQAANKTYIANLWVETNALGVIAYQSDAATWTSLSLVVRGWFVL